MPSTSVAARPTSGIFRWIPALDSLRSYSRGAFQADLLAGLSVAAVAVPQAMAYAMIAGLPAEYGLYTAIVMTAVGAVLDSSRQLINGPTNVISIAVLSALAVATTPEERISGAIGGRPLLLIVRLLIRCLLPRAAATTSARS